MKYILIISLLLTAAVLFAVPVTLEQAETAARNWTATWASPENDLRSIERVTPLSLDGETNLYLFEYSDGYVLTSADDAVYPVLAYGFDTVVGNPERNPAFWEHLQSLMQEITQVKAGDFNNSETAARWQDVLNNNLSRNDTRSVSPLISTSWNQGWPYNMYCPVDAAGPGGHVYAGCVASAMAQVAKYWNWPVTGTGSHTYYAYGYGSQTANFGATTYMWAQMPNSVHEQNEAVARLMYHMGVSVDMMYAPDGSGAYSQDVPEALMSHFGYASGVQMKQKSNYSASAWEQMLRDEIDSARPLYYSGSGPGGGHAFNCDGYQNTNYFHFNWGWGGSYDGYYYVSNLNPGYTFNSNQGAVFNIVPQNYSIASVQMSLSGLDCSVGDMTTLSVISYPIMPAWNVTDVSFIIEFDESDMNFMGYDLINTMLEGGEIAVTQIQPGRVSVSGSVNANLMGAGTLLKLNFQPMVPGNFAFNLADFSLNTTSVPLVAPTSINVTAEVDEVQNSMIDIQNAMHIAFDDVATIPLTTSFILPNWNVTTASFVLNYTNDLVSWEGFETEECLTQNAVVDVQSTNPGELTFNIDFNGNLVGSGNLLKLKFRATGNVGYVSLATLTVTDFYYNQTFVTNLQPGYIVLLPVTANDDGLIVPENRFTVGPNPFSSYTNLSLFLTKANQKADVSIYNLKGQLVSKLYSSDLKGTELALRWDGKDDKNKLVPAGMYLVKVKSGSLTKTVKLVKLK